MPQFLFLRYHPPIAPATPAYGTKKPRHRGLYNLHAAADADPASERCYFSINEMLRWMKSERFLPLSMPFDSSARSMI